jgi:hypothetical protein
MANDEEPQKKGRDSADDKPDSEEEEAAEGERPSFNARLARVVRTESSEVYIMWQDDVRLGQIDLHFGWDLIHATMILEKELTSQEQADLVELIDQDIVSSHLPRFAREDFLVTVFRGVELDPFSDGPEDDDDEDDDDLEEY